MADSLLNPVERVLQVSKASFHRIAHAGCYCFVEAVACYAAGASVPTTLKLAYFYAAGFFTGRAVEFNSYLLDVHFFAFKGLR